MRLIDAESLELAFNCHIQGYAREDYVDVCNYSTIIKTIDIAPTIDAVPLEQYQSMERTVNKLQEAINEKADAVEVVRCKDCIHCADDWIDTGMGTMPQFTCELGMCAESVQPTDYCSYGERSSE